jgi:hypothetical protein
MNLDGETNLKEKSAPSDVHDLLPSKIPFLNGSLV